jgi:tRNA(fMet)-specific endonuclease VapC
MKYTAVNQLPILTRYGILRATAPNRLRNALDRLIAAHASSLGATLITINEADFLDYPRLQVENRVAAA